MLVQAAIVEASGIPTSVEIACVGLATEVVFRKSLCSIDPGFMGISNVLSQISPLHSSTFNRVRFLKRSTPKLYALFLEDLRAVFEKPDILLWVSEILLMGSKLFC